MVAGGPHAVLDVRHVLLGARARFRVGAASTRNVDAAVGDAAFDRDGSISSEELVAAVMLDSQLTDWTDWRVRDVLRGCV